MVYTYTASDHQELCRAWVAQIRKHKYGHPFDPVTVVVPNMDMARWLQLQLADVAGISANIRFVLPAAWLREQFEALNPAAKEVLLDKSHLQWMIYTLLEEDNGTAPWSHLNYWVDKIASRASGDGDFASRTSGDGDFASRASGDGGAVSRPGNVSRPGADVGFGGVAGGSPDGIGDAGGGSNASKTSGELGPSGTAGTNVSAVSKSRWDIASQLADAFDQYIMYRPDWLVTWQGEKLSLENSLGELPTGEAAHWQSAMWSALCSRWPDIPNRANLWHVYMRQLATGASSGALSGASSGALSGASGGSRTGTSDSNLFEALAGNSAGASQGASPTASPSINPVFAYGLSALPLPIMRAFARHARSTDWHWFVQRRTISERSYLTDLNNYSFEQATVFAEVLQKEGVDGGVMRVDGGMMRVDADSTQSRPEPANNLQRIQGSVADDVPLAMDEADAGSVRVHVCHSARREVEVLYDSLLDLFNTTDVRPGDVAVVTPDPDAYRPFVEEVFRGGGRQMAVHVAGARRGAGDVGAEVMLRALKLIGTRYKVPDVLDWLEAEPVLGAITERSGLRHTLHNWILRQRIRWGIDARQLNRSGFPLSGRHTWKHGIDRLLLSWMASEGEDVVVQEILTGSTVAGQDTGALLGRFATVINAMADLQESSDAPRTLAEWCTILQHFSDQIFTASESGREHSASMHSALLKLRKTAEILHLDKPVAFTVLRSYLESLLDTAGLGRAWRPGTITFTGMVALHQLPFRVVAILGLNDGKLPGKTPVSAFDLIPDFSRKGDRSRRDADRQLFLDYLLTPDLRLHLSYTGMRQKDNKDLAPSVMLTMLEDFLIEKTPAEKRHILKKMRVRHALQPFSPKYFVKDNDELFSYSATYRSLAEALNGERSSRPPLFSPQRTVLSDGNMDTIGVNPVDSDVSMTSEAALSGEGSTETAQPGEISSETAQPGEIPSEPTASGSSTNMTGVNRSTAEPSNGSSSGTGPSTELTLTDLQQFFRDAVKALLRSKPGITLDESDVPGESTEPFSFDSLTGWQVRSQVMRTWLDSGDLTYSNIETYLRRDGILAEGAAGKRQMRVLVAELQEFVRYFEEAAGTKPSFTTMEADVAVTAASGRTYRISAMHPFMYNGTAWNFEAGQGGKGIPARKKVRHYLAHLVLNMVWPVQSRVIFRDSAELIFRPMSVSEADIRLSNILSVYEEGHKAPLPFFPACMQQYVASLKEGLSAQESLSTLIEDLSDEPGMYAKEFETEVDSIWVHEAFGDTHPLQQDDDRQLCGLPDRPAPLTTKQFQEYQLFTLMATHIIDVMNADILTAPTDMTGDQSQTEAP